MPKIYKATNARETMCKDLHMKMNMHKGPTKLVSPTLFLLVDTDELQKQVNRLENEVNHMRRMEAREGGEENDKTKIQGGKRWNAYNEHEKEYPRTKAKDWKLTTCPQCGQQCWESELARQCLKKDKTLKAHLYRMRVRREKIGHLLIIITGLITTLLEKAFQSYIMQ